MDPTHLIVYIPLHMNGRKTILSYKLKYIYMKKIYEVDKLYVCMRGVGELRDDVSFYISNEFFIAIYI